MHKVFVDVGHDSYNIYIGKGELKNVGQYMRGFSFSPSVLVVTNPVVRQYYGSIVEEALTSAGFVVRVVEIPAGEETKTMEWAMCLYDAAIAHGMDRKSPIVALGGGVIGDLTGFVAATYMRGIPFIQIPTTLLAQVDSSVGGKVAVNHPEGKNLIGAFYQPKFVVIDPDTLVTLPQREWLSGLAEVIKYGVIEDAEFFRLLTNHTLISLQQNADVLTQILRRSCEIKARVVSTDEKEAGLRIILNYGHTIAHAIESGTGYTKYTHGEAVAIGMVGAAMLAQKMQWLSQEETNRIRSLISDYGLPVQFSGVDVSVAEELLYHDKKKEGAAVRWVLPRKIGTVDTSIDVPVTYIREVLTELSR